VSDLSNHPKAAKRAVIYRMVMPEHVCPWGLKARDLLKRSGYEVEDHHLTTRAETDAFKAEHRVAVLFTLMALSAVAATYAVTGELLTARTVQWFIAFSMVVLAMLKLQNVETFSAMFLNYDLLARRWVPYSYVYPYAEALAGLLMIAGALSWLSVPLALFIGTIGAVSVFKAVYVDKRELKCACVGGSSNVPLGFVSLTENLMMIAMAVWMAADALSGM
jgi:hypothetical protein